MIVKADPHDAAMHDLGLTDEQVAVFKRIAEDFARTTCTDFWQVAESLGRAIKPPMSIQEALDHSAIRMPTEPPQRINWRHDRMAFLDGCAGAGKCR